MHHKANRALALAGFKSKTHSSTLLGIRGVFNESGLVDELRKALNERKNVEYYISPDKPELEEYKDPKSFIENTVNSFFEKRDEIIDNEF